MQACLREPGEGLSISYGLGDKQAEVEVYLIIVDKRNPCMDVRKIAKPTFSFITPVCPSAWNNSATTGRILLKFGI